MLKKKAISMFIAVIMSVMFFPGTLLPANKVQAADTSSGLVARWTFDGNYTETVNGLVPIWGLKI